MSINQQARSGLKWSAIERFATQAVQLIVMLILAKQLGPEAFGLVGLVAVVLSIAQVFVDSGFSTGLIRKLDRTESDLSTTFYFSIVTSLVCYVAIFLSAESIALFFDKPPLRQLIQVASLSIIINAFGIIQRAKLTIDVNFKVQAKCSFSAVLLSSLVGLYGAYNDYGVWSLVAQTLTMATCNVLFLNIAVVWFPSKPFCKSSFKELFGFGSKLLLSGLIDRVFKNIYPIVIGKQFSVSDVGQFTQAHQLTSVPAMTFTNVIQRVTYPLLSKMQNEPSKLDASYLLALKLSALVLFPLMFGLSVSADLLLKLILGEEWHLAGELVGILAIGMALYPIHAINLNILNVKGRSDLFLRLEIIKKVLITLVLLITIPYGITAICIGMVIQSYLGLCINTYYTGQLTSISAKSQLKELLPIWLLALVCTYGAKTIVHLIQVNNYAVSLLLLILGSVLSYMLMVKLLFPELFKYVSSKRSVE